MPLSEILAWLLSKLSGWKTYIIAAALGLIAFGNYCGCLPPELMQLLLALTGAGGLATLRSAVAKVEQQTGTVTVGADAVATMGFETPQEEEDDEHDYSPPHVN